LTGKKKLRDGGGGKREPGFARWGGMGPGPEKGKVPKNVWHSLCEKGTQKKKNARKRKKDLHAEDRLNLQKKRGVRREKEKKVHPCLIAADPTGGKGATSEQRSGGCEREKTGGKNWKAGKT